MNTRYIYLVVFFSGMSVLAIELSAARLLGAYFGTSNLVWASIIGLILIYLAVGYFWGGGLADRSPSHETMYTLLAWGGFSAGLVPLVSRLFLPAAARAFDALNMGALGAAFFAVLFLLIVPIILLGTISPFAIRLSIPSQQDAGKISGRIYALSTLGSFIGSFLPDLVMIPWMGTTLTFMFFSVLLVWVALVGLYLAAGWRSALRMVWMPVVLLLLAFWVSQQPYKTTPGQVFETESSYNYIEIVQDAGYTYLRLNEGQGVHSVYHPTILDYNGPWEQFLVAPFFNPGFMPNQVERIAVVGLAAGTVARQATAVFGPVPMDGYEIDSKIIEVGREYFGMDMPHLNAYAQDGRWGLDHSDYQYTLIALDAYRPPYIPWHLTTSEFFGIVRSKLTNQGAMAINVGRSHDDTALLDGLVGSIKPHFASVHLMNIPNTLNSIIYATVQPTSFADLSENFVTLQANGQVHPLLLDAMATAINFQQVLPPGETQFTDDRAPVEWIVNRMVFEFVLTGGLKILQ